MVRDTRTINIDVKQSNALPRNHKRRGEVHGHGVFANAAFARQYNYFVPKAAKPRLEFSAVLEFLIAFVFLAIRGRAILVPTGVTCSLCTAGSPLKPLLDVSNSFRMPP